MRGLFETLWRPDRDDDPERTEIAKAANLLQIGEFQLLQLAYYSWFGEEMSPAVSDQIFRSYMIEGRVPPWVRHYARQIIAQDESGRLEDNDPAYHRYDAEYYKALPLGARRLAMAVACISFVVVGGLLVGHFAPRDVTSVLPPYFNADELRPAGKAAYPTGGGLRGS